MKKNLIQPKDKLVDSELKLKSKDLEVAESKILQKKYVLDKARHRSIELFSEKQELKKDYNEVITQNQEVELQKKEIEAKNERLERAIKKARRRTIDLFGKHIDLKKASKRIEFQNNLIETKNKELEDKSRAISESLAYAKLIQQAILPSPKFINNKFPESFVLFRPKDVVSGDFYWYSEREHLQFFALADCTGHGVPGALMSMIGNSLLNKIVENHKNDKPSQILKLLSKEVIFALNQSFDIETSQNDGMDITLCQIDNIKKEFTIASAIQNYYVLSEGNMQVIKGDFFSIGGLFADYPDFCFTDHKFKLSRETIIYMLSDGYKDQFGGPEGRKFMRGNLKTVLLKNAHLPMQEQKIILERIFENWKGKHKQIDDVLVIGLKLKPD